MVWKLLKVRVIPMPPKVNLAHFHDAQRRAHATALGELEKGKKSSHWMWYIFPQLTSLGRSGTARRYGLASVADARSYLADAVLGSRLRQCSRAVVKHRGKKNAVLIMGHTDALKLRSSATLFLCAGGGRDFVAVLDAFYDGDGCPATIQEAGMKTYLAALADARAEKAEEAREAGPKDEPGVEALDGTDGKDGNGDGDEDEDEDEEEDDDDDDDEGDDEEEDEEESEPASQPLS